MSLNFLRILLMFSLGALATGSVMLQPRMMDDGTQKKAKPDIRKMIEEAIAEKDPIDIQRSQHGSGAAYQLIEDPITRQLILKTNVVEVKPEEPTKEYALDIKDLYSIDTYLKNLRDHIRIGVFGDIQSLPSDSQLDRGYAIYKDLTNIRNRYFTEKRKINEKADYLKKVADFAYEYTKNAPQADLTNILSERDVDLDSYNRFILTQFVERLVEEMTAFHKAITIGMADFFNEYDKVTRNKAMTVYSIIEQTSKIAFSLSIIEQNELIDRVNRMIKIRQFIMDNKFYHHISASFDKELKTCSAGKLIGLILTGLLALLI